MYLRGMSVRDMQAMLEKLYQVEVWRGPPYTTRCPTASGIPLPCCRSHEKT